MASSRKPEQLRQWRIQTLSAGRVISAFFLLLLATTTHLAATTKKPPLKPINLNTATSEELQQVPGIGPVTAEKILQMRKSYGLFQSVDDLLAIRGIGKKRLEKMRKYLTAGRPALPARPAAANNSAQAAKCPGCAKGIPPPAKAAAPKVAASPAKPSTPPKKAAVEPTTPVPESQPEEPESR